MRSESILPGVSAACGGIGHERKAVTQLNQLIYGMMNSSSPAVPSTEYGSTTTLQ